MLNLSQTPDKDRDKFAELLRTTLRKALMGGDPTSLMQEVNNVLSS